MDGMPLFDWTTMPAMLIGGYPPHQQMPPMMMYPPPPMPPPASQPPPLIYQPDPTQDTGFFVTPEIMRAALTSYFAATFPPAASFQAFQPPAPMSFQPIQSHHTPATAALNPPTLPKLLLSPQPASTTTAAGTTASEPSAAAKVAPPRQLYIVQQQSHPLPASAPITLSSSMQVATQPPRQPAAAASGPSAVPIVVTQSTVARLANIEALRAFVPRRQRSHPCDLCGKAFSCTSNRDRHRRLHTGEKPFTCLFCVCAAFA